MSQIDEIRSGNADAIKQLYQENAQDVYDFARKITGNSGDAVAISQETMQILVQQIQNGYTPADLNAEALKIAFAQSRKYASVQENETQIPDAPKTEPEYEEPEYEEPDFDEGYYPEEDGYEEDDYYHEPPRRDEYPRRNEPPRRKESRLRGYYDDYEPPRNKVKEGKGAGFYLCLIINIILFLLIVWLALGLLMNLRIIPYYDLGYVWFDDHIFRLF